MDYKKLVNDLIVAKEEGIKAAKGEDGGTANSDCVFLRMPRAREKKVIQAIKKSGLYCRCKTKWIGNGYMIVPPGGGIGDSRNRAMEAMLKVLEGKGYDVISFCKMD